MSKQVVWAFGLFAFGLGACGDNTPAVPDPGTVGGSTSTPGGAGSVPLSPTPDTTVAPTVPGATCAAPAPGEQTMTRPTSPPLQLGSVSLPVAPPAISGGTLLVLGDGVTAVAADADRDRVYIVDLTAPALRSIVMLQPGDEPGRVVQDRAGTVHVALRAGGSVVSIDPALGVITDRRAVCTAPRGIAYDAAVDLLHVACAGGELVSLRTSGGPAIRTLSLPQDLRDVIVDGPQLRVTRFRSAELLTVDSEGRVSGKVGLPAVRSTATRGGQLFSPAVAWRAVGMPNGGVAMVHQRGVDDEVQTNVTGGYGTGRNNCDSIIHTSVSVVGADGAVKSGPALADLPVAVDMAVSPDGGSVAVISAGNAGNSRGFMGLRTGLFVADVTTATNGTVGCHGFGGSVSCSGKSCTGGHIPTVTGQPIAVAFAPDGDVIVQSRQPATLSIPGFAPLTLSSETRADPGHDVFHVNAGGSLACASCHAEGRDDGRTWNFACFGQRRTQSMQVGLRGTEPFHWSGDERDFPTLVHDVFTSRMSGPVLSDAQIDMTLSWMDAQPRMRRALPSDIAAVERGRTHFVNAACGTCHAGERFTNNLSMDVGTGGAFQVPSLVGIGARAPYLHNGCAATLRDRFSPACGGGDKHGLTSQLTPAEVSDLVSYLESL